MIRAIADWLRRWCGKDRRPPRRRRARSHSSARSPSSWREGYSLPPGASALALQRLEERLGVPLPEGLRRFYATANGSGGKMLGENLVTFWSIDEIFARELDPKWNGLRVAPGDLLFADECIEAYGIALRVDPGGAVRVVLGSSDNVLESWDEFWRWSEVRPDEIGA